MTGEQQKFVTSKIVNAFIAFFLSIVSVITGVSLDNKNQRKNTKKAIEEVIEEVVEEQGLAMEQVTQALISKYQHNPPDTYLVHN